MKKIEFYKHNLNNTDKKECLKVLSSLFLTTGPIVQEFEKKFAKYLSAKYVVGLTSCTEALFLSLKALGIKNGDEVLTTPLSFVSTANAIEYCGAKPVFVDVEELTGNIDANLIEKAITKKTKAICVVHLYGQMCDMKKIRSIASKYNLKIVEDAAHCMEGKRDGIRVGQLGDIACYSFYAIKNMTSGEGGAVSTNSLKIFEWIRKARLHGLSTNAAERYSKIYKHYDMEFLGYKANMTDIQASLLIHQLDRIDKYRKKKEQIAQIYNKGFKNNALLGIPADIPKSEHARYIYTIWVNKKIRDKFITELQKRKVGVAVNFRPIHLMKFYKTKYFYKKGDFPVAENIGASTITIPLYPKLKISEIRYIIKSVNNISSYLDSRNFK